MLKKTLILGLILALIPLSKIIAQSDSNVISQTTGVNYSTLEEFLREKDWRKANDETLKLLLKATGADKRGWFMDREVPSLACEDLRIVDQLWTKYSNGRFGFSVQLPIFLETGNRPGRMNTEAYQRFGDRIGWRRGNEWIIFYENLNFTDSAPVGHLPNPRLPYELTGGMLEMSHLTKRLTECQ